MGLIEDARKRRNDCKTFIETKKNLFKRAIEVSPINRFTFVESENSLWVMDGEKSIVTFLFSEARILVRYSTDSYWFNESNQQHWNTLGSYLLSVLEGEE